MAITGRAARQTSLNTFSTPEVVGPGSYISTDREVPVHGFAPFSSTTQRAIPGGSALKAANPGPGTYEATEGMEQPAAVSAFVSSVHREFEDRPSRAPKKPIPGPGTYELKEEWVHSQRWASSAPPAAQKHAQNGVAFTAKSHPPSIPVHVQSYGYEETNTGDLVMQPPPSGGFSGVSGRASVGPGDYNPGGASRFTKPGAQSAHFGNSRVQRNMLGNLSKVPGPGAYLEEGDKKKGRGGSSFLSSVPMSHQAGIDSEKVLPGPGAYNAAVGMKPDSIPANLQTFGSTQKRLASDAITPNERAILAQPGPGSYERGSDFTPARKADPAVASASGFSSSSTRFNPLRKMREPGPGAYDELDQNTFVVAMQRKTHGRNGVFGSTTRRFHTLQKDPVPGAGSYDPQQAVGNAAKDEATNAVFTSGVDRFPAKPTSTKTKKAQPAPAPWQYQLKSSNAWDAPPGASRKADMTFGSTSERFSARHINGAPVKPVPGPGAYAPTRPGENLRIVSHTECFGTKEERFGASRVATSKAVPGPGTYESAVSEVDPLIKRSYNITIG